MPAQPAAPEQQLTQAPNQVVMPMQPSMQGRPMAPMMPMPVMPMAMPYQQQVQYWYIIPVVPPANQMPMMMPQAMPPMYTMPAGQPRMQMQGGRMLHPRQAVPQVSAQPQQPAPAQ
jgi:hypothetical protein